MPLIPQFITTLNLNEIIEKLKILKIILLQKCSNIFILKRSFNFSTLNHIMDNLFLTFHMIFRTLK